MIDYSKYSIEELLDVQKNIDPNSPNYSALIEAIENRKNEIQDVTEEAHQNQYDLDKLKVKTVGVFQLASACILSLIILYNVIIGDGVSALTALIAVPLIGLNSVAGLTAFKQISKWYWVSVSNQILQLFSFSLGSYYVNYAGIGYINIVISWGQELSLGFDAKFSPGFGFYKYTEILQTQFVGVDILAIVFILAFVRLKNFETRA